MKSRIISSSYVTGFQDVEFDSEKIEASIKLETDEMLAKFNYETLADWEVQFIFRYNNVRSILIYKKDLSYPVEKYKEITIHIPIPTKDVVAWGVNRNQHVYEIDHLDNKVKNFKLLDVNINQYRDRTEYITNCMRRSISYCFETGIVINGVEIKIEDVSK